MTLRSVFFITISLVAGYAFQARSESAPTSTWRISFEPQPAEFRQSDPYKTLLVFLKNISDHGAWIWESNALNDYSLSLTGSRGNVIPMTSHGLETEARHRSIDFGTGKVQVPPGSFYKSHINLSDFYDLPVGRYVVHVRLRARNQDNFDWNTKKPLVQPERDVPIASSPIEIKP
jgi:hypothetical protein